MMKKKNVLAISIVVPVYRVEKYLRKCIDSILSQSFTDFELILVDDGSPDGSGKICDEYAAKDLRVKVIHQANKGASAARNTGIDASKGEYILFVDSDDYIDPDYIEVLYNNRTDFTVCGVEKQKENGDTTSIVKYSPYFAEEAINYEFLFSSSEIYSPYCKCFVSAIIKRNKVSFPVGIPWGEDGIFVADYLEHVKRVKYLDYVGYHYIRYQGQSTLSSTIRSDIMDLIRYTREYCIHKVEALSPQNYEKTKEIIINNIVLNCADFVKRVLHSSLSKSEKADLLHEFLKSEYVIMSIDTVTKYYNKAELNALKSKNASRIVKTYPIHSFVDASKASLKKRIRRIKRFSRRLD